MLIKIQATPELRVKVSVGVLVMVSVDVIDRVLEVVVVPMASLLDDVSPVEVVQVLGGGGRTV